MDTSPQLGRVIAVVGSEPAGARTAVVDRAAVVVAVGPDDAVREAAAAAGADGLLVTLPGGGGARPGVLAHLRAVTAATDLPVVLHDPAAGTGDAVGPGTLRAALRLDRVVGVLDTSGDPTRAADLAALGADVYRADPGADGPGGPGAVLTARLAEVPGAAPPAGPGRGSWDRHTVTAETAAQLLGSAAPVPATSEHRHGFRPDQHASGLISDSEVPSGLDPWWGTYRGLAADG